MILEEFKKLNCMTCCLLRDFPFPEPQRGIVLVKCGKLGTHRGNMELA